MKLEMAKMTQQWLEFGNICLKISEGSVGNLL